MPKITMHNASAQATSATHCLSPWRRPPLALGFASPEFDSQACGAFTIAKKFVPQSALRHHSNGPVPEVFVQASTDLMLAAFAASMTLTICPNGASVSARIARRTFGSLIAAIRNSA